jgi:serine/threonine protein phosphatase PrpC
MACVLTVAVVRRVATIGHVGDTRLYKVRDRHIEKITRDHSPVGERETRVRFRAICDAPSRRNEVYRDVGLSSRADDPEFVDIHDPFDPGDGLPRSDGLMIRRVTPS